MSLFALCLGFFMIIIDVMIVNVALPNIATNLSSSLSGLQWVVDGYTLTFTCLLLSTGTLSDKLGAKAGFITGLLLFVVTSIGCGLAPSILILTIFRLLQGVAAALIVPTSIALINASYADSKARAKAIGIWATVGGIGAAAGPILGALLTAGFGWRSVFFINIPVGLLAVYLTFKYVSSPTSKKQAGFDLTGQIMAIISIASLAIGLIEAGKTGWLSRDVIIAFSLFLISFPIFLLIEYFSKSPMLPLQFFKSKMFSSTMFVGTVLNIGFYGILFILPLYFHQVRGYSVLMSGLALIPLVFFNAFSTYFSGRLVGLIGSKTPMLIGLTLGTLGFLSLLSVEQTTPAYAWFILPLIAIGVGTTFIMPAATIAIIQSVPKDRAGMASGVFNASRQLGSLIGVAIFGTIISTATSFVNGMHTSLIIAAIGFISAALAVVFSFKRVN